MSEPTVTITKAEYDALQKVAECWDDRCDLWRKAMNSLFDLEMIALASEFEDAINAMDEAVAEAVRKEKKA